MSETVKCPNCRVNLQRKTVDCVVCSESGEVEKKLYNQYVKLAAKLRKETQILYKYFEIENLLLVNISLTQDPNRYQEYAVYRREKDGSLTKVESVTVNSPNTSRISLAALFMSISRQPLSDFDSQIRAYNDKLTAEEFETFKSRFAAYEAAC